MAQAFLSKNATGCCDAAQVFGYRVLVRMSCGVRFRLSQSRTSWAGECPE
ncbi:MAG: hypothetical protein ACI8PT_002647 [Gammaproteobacteria bacterium]|jgi:hypothetical protein